LVNEKIGANPLGVTTNSKSHSGMAIKDNSTFSKIEHKVLDWKYICNVKVTVTVIYKGYEYEVSTIVSCKNVDKTEKELVLKLTEVAIES